jgi:hypothetical protein
MTDEHPNITLARYVFGDEVACRDDMPDPEDAFECACNKRKLPHGREA